MESARKLPVKGFPPNFLLNCCSLIASSLTTAKSTDSKDTMDVTASIPAISFWISFMTSLNLSLKSNVEQSAALDMHGRIALSSFLSKIDSCCMDADCTALKAWYVGMKLFGIGASMIVQCSLPTLSRLTSIWNYFFNWNGSIIALSLINFMLQDHLVDLSMNNIK